MNVQCRIRLHVSAGCPTAKYGHIPFQKNKGNLSHLVSFVRANKINTTTFGKEEFQHSFQ